MPTATQDPAVTMLEQLAAAEADVRSGQFEAVIDYGAGQRSVATVRFDLGDAQQLPRLHMMSTYESAEGPQTVEQITIGTVAWERQADGAWVEVSDQTIVWDQVQTFLPHTESAANPELVHGANTTALRWTDPSRNADVTLVIDPDTTLPRELRRLTRTTGAVLTVHYTGWNTPVEIVPPEGV